VFVALVAGFGAACLAGAAALSACLAGAAAVLAAAGAVFFGAIILLKFKRTLLIWK